MAKRVLSACGFAREKNGNYFADHHISRMPDEILIIVLSHMTMKEAARTSVLSHRWEKLWTFTNLSLEFDGSSSFDGLRRKKKSIDVERSRFVSWVNKVSQSHKGSSIDELAVRFDLDNTSSGDIDSWLNFAVEKGVQSFELDLNCFLVGSFKSRKSVYSFPFEKFSSSPSNVNFTKLLQSNGPIAMPFDFAGICPLTSLTLKHVDVVDQAVEGLLSNCPLLKYLCLIGSTNLVNLKVVSPSFNLIHLHISYCFNVKNLEILAINLSSFTYVGPKINMPFKSMPQLSTVCIGGSCSPHFVSAFRDYSGYLSQIETLTLDLSFEKFKRIPSFPVKFPGLSNIKQLELVLTTDGDCSLLRYTTLIKASPLLHRLIIQLIMTEPLRQLQKEGSSSPIKRKFKEVTEHPYECLKVVELAGFVGCTADMELAIYFLKSARSLDKMIINPENLPLRGPLWNILETKRKQAARKCARQLKTKVYSGVELVVL